MASSGDEFRDHSTAAHVPPADGIRTTSPMTALPRRHGEGDTVGPYRLIRELASGGFGRVFLAERQHPFHQTVALKLLKPELESADLIARFRQEWEALASLNHPHIAKVFDAGIPEGGHPYFVMEFVGQGDRPGLPITLYAAQRRLTIDERLALFIPVCEAVAHAHHDGIIHRDLKPSNVLVAEADRKAIPKVIDFGIAKFMSRPPGGSSVQTRAGSPIGTPAYMSPEQSGRVVGASVDERTDVYSLGVMLFELLTGRLPFDEVDDRGERVPVWHRIPDIEPIRPSTLSPAIASDLETVLLRAIDRDPARRLPSAAALASELRHVLAGEPIDTRRDSLAYVLRVRARRLCARHEAAVMLLAGVATFVLAWALTLGLFYKVTKAGAWYQTVLATQLPPPTPPRDSLAHSRLVLLDDAEPVERLGELAGVQGVIPGFGRPEMQSLRPVHAEIIRRVIDAGASGVVVDIFLRTAASPGLDEPVVKAIEYAQQRGRWIVFCARNWTLELQQTPEIAPAFLPLSPPVGAVGLSTSFGAATGIQLAAQRDEGDLVPSAVTLSFALWRHPTLTPRLRLDAEKNELKIFYMAPGSFTQAQYVDTLKLKDTSVYTPVPGANNIGLEDGDLLALLHPSAPAPAAASARTTTYGQALSASPEQLRQLVEGTIVYLGDGRKNRPERDYQELPHGEIVQGTLLFAATLESMIDQTTSNEAAAPRVPPPWVDPIALASGSLAGVLLGRGLASRWTRFASYLAVSVMLIGCSLLSYVLSQLIVNPSAPVLAVFLGGELAAFIRSARQGVPSLVPLAESR